MTMTGLKIFSFLRGAVRGAYGVEDFRCRKILIIGMSRLGQELLNNLCIDDVQIRFQDCSIRNCSKALTVCREVDFYKGEHVDVVVDLNNNYVCIKDKVFPVNEITENAYTQGFHAFYL